MPTWLPSKQQLIAHRHRAAIVLCGERNWCQSQLELPQGNVLWLGASAPEGTTQVNAKQARQWLGQECDALVIDAFEGIDLNALGALAGTIKAGGRCWLLCPPLAQWPQLPDSQARRFCVYPEDQSPTTSLLNQWLVNTIKASPFVIVVEQDKPLPQPALKAVIEPEFVFEHPTCLTQQQVMAVTRIRKVAEGHRKRPLVLTADRGRGKSSALGLAVAELLQAGKQHIIVSAPQLDSVQAVFARAREQLTVETQTHTLLDCAEGTLQFMAPDEIIRTRPKTDLLLIDEAAAIPAPMLTELLKHYSRIVFTSTISGYEGTGRGFEVRFKKTLSELTPQWQAWHMDTPIRWANGDPLEAFVNQALLLDTQAAEISDGVKKREPIFSLLDKQTLVQQPRLLSQIIGLLTLAHYKTTPNDLRHLLDGNNIEVFVLSHADKVIGTALIAREGALPDDLAQAIFNGERRPRGHLLPQTLCYHAGFLAAAAPSYARVVRIAIHPDIQQQGLGSKILTELAQHYRQQGLDFVGSSFGATADLLRFWRRNGFIPARLGQTLEATSNEYSAVVLKPLSITARFLTRQLHHTFTSALPRQLTGHHQYLAPQALAELLKDTPVKPLSPNELALLTSYLDHKREYEFAEEALHKVLLNALTGHECEQLSTQELQLMVDKVLRKHSWQTVVKSTGLTGKKAAVEALKAAFGKLAD